MNTEEYFDMLRKMAVNANQNHKDHDLPIALSAPTQPSKKRRIPPPIRPIPADTSKTED